jgi:magnesium transporter
MDKHRIDFADFHWLDVNQPSPADLKEIAAEYQLHANLTADCLQSDHLPKFETTEEAAFLILRAFDNECNPEADTVQELTRKVAVFYSHNFLITVHRKRLEFMEDLFTRHQQSGASNKGLTPEHILIGILEGAVKTYERPTMESLKNLEEFEMEIFGAGTGHKFALHKGYYLKRRASVFKRMLRQTQEPLAHVMENAESGLLPHFRNVREHIDNVYFYADEIIDSMDSLLNLHVSLASMKTNEASQRTNEVMRVLTIFSAFFLPINFIAGVYGMNFKYMPELDSPYGYWGILGFMSLIVVVIFFWFRRNGWMK